MKALGAFVLGSATALVLACSSSNNGGGTISNGGNATITVTISPMMATVKVNHTVEISGEETAVTKTGSSESTNIDGNATAFDWAITESTGGTIMKDSFNSTSYTYTAPATPGTYHVVITDRQQRAVTATSVITVTP
jgi:hypothetical protein